MRTLKTWVITACLVLTSALLYSQSYSKIDKPQYLFADGDTFVVFKLAHLDSANVRLLEWQYYRKLVAEQGSLIQSLEESLESCRYTTEYYDLDLAESNAAYKSMTLAADKYKLAFDKQVKLTKDTKRVVRRRWLGISAGALIGGFAAGILVKTL